MAQRAWVTGAQGFLGTHVAAALERDGISVIRIARKPWIEQGSSIALALDLAQASEFSAVAEKFGPPDQVWHCAGNGSVGQSFADPEADRVSAVHTTQALLDFLACSAPAAQLIFPSSAAVYGDHGRHPLDEDMPLSPVSPYGHHKLEAEQLCRLSGLSVLVIRYFSLYGPGLRKQLFFDLAGKLLRAAPREPVTMFGSGQETRDFLHVSDAVALARFEASQNSSGFKLVNGGTGRATTIEAAAHLFRDAFGKSNPISFTGEKSRGAPEHLVAGAPKSHRSGFTTAIDFETGIAGYAEWLARELTGLRG